MTRDNLFRGIHTKLFGYPLFFGVAVICVFAMWQLFFYLTSVELPSEKTPITLYSNQAKDDLFKLHHKALSSAQKKVYLRVYGLTDPSIISLLSHKAENGAHITASFDAKGSGPHPKKLSSKVVAYPIRSKGLMHQKIFISDDDLTLIGTANLTPQSLKMHDNLVVGLRSKEFANLIENIPVKNHSLNIGKQKVDYWNLPDISGAAEAEICTQIERANKSIYVAMFTLTHPIFADHLIKAKKRGVDVRVAVDGYTAKGASKKTVERLKASGIPIYPGKGIQLLHHKWAWIDSKKLIVGSANWTKAAFQKNDDCFLILDDLTKKQQNVMKTVWKRSTHQPFIL